MKKRIFSLLLGLSLISMALVGCESQVHQEELENSLKVYFYNAEDGSLITENVAVDLAPNTPSDKLLDVVIKALYKGAQTTNTLQTKLTLPIDAISLKDGIVSINFDGTYELLSPQEQIATRASLVYSLTQLDFVKAVDFSMKGKPLTNLMGDVIGAVTYNDVVTNVLEPNPPTTQQKIKLYFANAEGTALVKEERMILTNNSIPLERYVVEELIKGPQIEGLHATLPKETKLNAITTKDGVCQVDLSFDIKSKHFTSSLSKKLMVYSIVNALTDLPEPKKSDIRKVAFLIDGKKESEFSKDIDLSEFLGRDESLIAKD
ncbi:hypothetical protein CS063_05505 [Sporanaerobium hydrogeniformans]|uniref:Uncharacterized protein n=1 Tax=Sporanaerobium hydrogeniformans TaxID=3072179 RepID=A0AC61DFB1_9FIRM|nr:GerMN domain-containing protein [Sporanaerobium hydrogeniformans]PHV71503.1 hypothetical protein CS063_05505 [Sporanaerobium hydrogeniformans]